MWVSWAWILHVLFNILKCSNVMYEVLLSGGGKCVSGRSARVGKIAREYLQLIKTCARTSSSFVLISKAFSLYFSLPLSSLLLAELNWRWKNLRKFRRKKTANDEKRISFFFFNSLCFIPHCSSAEKIFSTTKKIYNLKKFQSFYSFLFFCG